MRVYYDRTGPNPDIKKNTFIYQFVVINWSYYATWSNKTLCQMRNVIQTDLQL